MNAVEKSTIRKIYVRLLPLLFICYISNYLDRVNVGFGALGMNRDLGLSAAAFSIGGGIFFVSYFLFEVPSNYCLEKVGARLWIGRIMITWGAISAMTAFVWNAQSFYAVRFMLGMAEAGFFPGIVLYLTYWFPAKYHGKAIGGFLLAIPFSTLVGSLVSGLLLGLDGVASLHGWQWLFIIEGLPAVIMGVVILIWLPSRPERATWLSPAEKSWLAQALADDEATHSSHSVRGFLQSIISPTVILFGTAYVGIVAAQYGVGFFLPSIIKNFGVSDAMTGFVAAIPYGFAVVAMWLWIRHSDKTGERVWHTAIACFMGALGFAASAVTSNPELQMIAFTFAVVGIFTAVVSFWTLPPAFLTASATAGGLALINALGNIGGFGGPYVVGMVKDWTGSYDNALLMLGAFIFITGLSVVGLCKNSASINGRRGANQAVPIIDANATN